jgi:hypothetical protein
LSVSGWFARTVIPEAERTSAATDFVISVREKPSGPQLRDAPERRRSDHRDRLSGVAMPICQPRPLRATNGSAGAYAQAP